MAERDVLRDVVAQLEASGREHAAQVEVLGTAREAANAVDADTERLFTHLQELRSALGGSS
jgi:hypothetical protein